MDPFLEMGYKIPVAASIDFMSLMYIHEAQSGLLMTRQTKN